LDDDDVTDERIARVRCARGGVEDIPVVVGRYRRCIRKTVKAALARINVIGQGLCGVDIEDKKIPAVVWRAAVQPLTLGRKFDQQGTADVANAVSEVERDVPCLSQALRSCAAL